MEDLKNSLSLPCETNCYNLKEPNKVHFSQVADQVQVLTELFGNKVCMYFFTMTFART